MGIEDLITTEDKLVYIQKMAEHMDHGGGLFRPDSQWFNQPPTVEQLNVVLKKLCQWLGTKPRQLDVEYSGDLGEATGSYCENDDGHHIRINECYARKSFQAIAILAHELTHYVVVSRWHMQLADETDQEQLIDLASIHLGFGCLIINGRNRHETWVQRLAANLKIIKDAEIGSFSSAEFAYQLGHQVATSTKTSLDELYSQLAPWNRHLFGKHPKHIKTALFVQSADKRIRNGNVVFVGSLLAATAVIATMLFIYVQLPARYSASLSAKKEQIDTLYTDFVLCQQTVASRKANMPKADIPEQQSINADANRCLSIQNEYNAAVDTYNQELGVK